MTKEETRKHKYKVGQELYCRPWKSTHQPGCYVYKCIVREASKYISGDTPYYSLEIMEGGEGSIGHAYEEEMSRRPEKLVDDAMKAIQESFGGYIETYEKLVSGLQMIVPDDDRLRTICYTVTDSDGGMHGVYYDKVEAEERRKETQIEFEKARSRKRVIITPSVII
jgi:hypothetical protein